LYEGVNEFRKGWQPKVNLIKDKDGDFLADPSDMLNRWKNYFNDLLNVHVGDKSEVNEVHTAEPLVPEPNLTEVKDAIKRLKNNKAPGIDLIPN
ncbi:hypothetical protein SOP87_30190, partial [Bacillus cereus]|uniref:hypothetical protein n=1 Tax=Bacillus cereus TaxID=1396 RepID=UPI002B246C52